MHRNMSFASFVRAKTGEAGGQEGQSKDVGHSGRGAERAVHGGQVSCGAAQHRTAAHPHLTVPG